MISPQFVCLSMIVSGRAWGNSPFLGAVDCLAHAIEREGDDTKNEWMVKQAAALFGHNAGPLPLGSDASRDQTDDSVHSRG